MVFAFPMMKIHLPFGEIEIEFNFLRGIVLQVPDNTYRDPIVLHHHSDVDDACLLRLTGVPRVDAVIARVNAILSSSRA